MHSKNNESVNLLKIILCLQSGYIKAQPNSFIPDQASIQPDKHREQYCQCLAILWLQHFAGKINRYFKSFDVYCCPAKAKVGKCQNDVLRYLVICNHAWPSFLCVSMFLSWGKHPHDYVQFLRFCPSLTFPPNVSLTHFCHCNTILSSKWDLRLAAQLALLWSISLILIG